MNSRKKYQVFISSTFTDMKAERQAAVEAILTAGHIPAGMELFSAGDELQLEVIKRWILQSDIYLLILGARYGSLEPKTRRSYTEIEYDYAVENNKPHFTLLLSEKALVNKREELESDGIQVYYEEMLAEFRAKVSAKMVRFVDDVKDIKIFLPEAIRGLEDRRSLAGWVRSDDVVDTAPLLQEITRLTDKNSELESDLEAALASVPTTVAGAPLADLDDNAEVAVEYKLWIGGSAKEQIANRKITWGRLFALISPKIIEHPADKTMKTYIGTELLDSSGIERWGEAHLSEQSHVTVRTHFEVLGLITANYSKSVDSAYRVYWNLTDRGRRLMAELRAVRKA
jgi:hypothetical protein